MTLDRYINGRMIPLELVSLAEMEGLAALIGKFLAEMQQCLPPSEDSEKVFGQLERLQACFSQKKINVLLVEELLALEKALMLFSLFLYKEVPRTEQREAAIAGLWKTRKRLRVLRKLSAAGGS